MTQPMIEQLIEKIISYAGYCTILDGMDMEFEKTKKLLIESRSALLSRIAEIESERDDWHKMAEALLSVRNENVITNDGKFTYCRYCGQISSNDSNIVHSIGCPVKKYNDLTARYAHPSEGKEVQK